MRKIFFITLLILGVGLLFSGTLVTAQNSGAPVPVSTDKSAEAVQLRVGSQNYPQQGTVKSIMPSVDAVQCPTPASISDVDIKECIANGGRMEYETDQQGCRIRAMCAKQLSRQPQLSISPQGAFVARGMIIKQISTERAMFVGEVWGTEWNVDVSGIPSFVLSSGAETNVPNVLSQLAIGEEVGVSGAVSASLPGVVKARVVRNYNISEITPLVRPVPSIRDVEIVPDPEDIDYVEASGAPVITGENASVTPASFFERIQNVFKKLRDFPSQVRKNN